MICPVILSGGSGSRLWPLSRELYPKQFLPLAGTSTMLQQTLQRLDGLAELTAPLIVCNEEHRFLVAEQLRQIEVTPAAILLEPLGRNTAPAIAVAALQVMAAGDDPLLLVLPSDHVILDRDALQQAILIAALGASAGQLVTFGIVPTAPETGYGYIRARGEGELLAVQAFVEKPNLPTATEYLQSGDYFWNSGMFLFRASRYLEELQRFAPDILTACTNALAGGERDRDFLRLDLTAFAACRSESIDYAVMEKTADAAVVPLDAGWNDLGSWSSLWDISVKDANANALNGDVVAIDCHNSFLLAESRYLAAIGIDDLIVVETADAVLVAKRDQVQLVKEIAADLKRSGRREALLHRKVHRPWGCYEGIDVAERYQVKRITVNPGASLSLQLHHHRAEHWVVVKGTARVTCGSEEIVLSENQSTYIPLGTLHRLENPGKIPLELIEIQSGSYLGEDDIVRIEDHYGR
ncbi:MAG: mannose-1-phosphate guanylyltransferase/mannose-6-phosphate isomerase [Desulfuromonadales bacterium]|nr:mannose-1-phosphate guanylyltransferase/mannose-6-phosphate isomerase [Desulfuromonadales bacterium]